jgi:hypothetical protein
MRPLSTFLLSVAAVNDRLTKRGGVWHISEGLRIDCTGTVTGGLYCPELRRCRFGTSVSMRCLDGACAMLR